MTINRAERTLGRDPDGATPVLWHLKVSNYNEKARWALDYKGILHHRRAVTPGEHAAIAKRLSGGNTFPVLLVDGKAIGDSTEIIAALERRQSEPPLYPTDSASRRLALELEDFFDEELGPYVRLLVIHHLLGDGGLVLRVFAPDLLMWRRVVARVSFPMVRRRLAGQFKIDEHSVKDAYGRVRAAGERFLRELQPSGYLVGESFTVADLTLAALIAPAVAPEQFPYPQPQRGHPLLGELRGALGEWGLTDWALDIYARHRSPSAAITG